VATKRACMPGSLMMPAWSYDGGCRVAGTGYRTLQRTDKISRADTLRNCRVRSGRVDGDQADETHAASPRRVREPCPRRSSKRKSEDNDRILVMRASVGRELICLHVAPNCDKDAAFLHFRAIVLIASAPELANPLIK
jgi:hypothetical protein